MFKNMQSVPHLSPLLPMLCLLMVFGCSDDASNTQTARPGPRPAPRLQQGQTTGAVAKARKPGEDDGRLKTPEITEASFIEGLTCRDPFAPFLEMFEESTMISTELQRDIKLEEHAITDLRLIGIITNIGNPKAMVVVPDGTGFVVKGGDYIGRTEFIKHSSGEMIPVNWKVARIHGSGKEEERGIYFKRDSTGLVDRKKIEVTRFLPLHPMQ